MYLVLYFENSSCIVVLASLVYLKCQAFSCRGTRWFCQAIVSNNIVERSLQSVAVKGQKIDFQKGIYLLDGCVQDYNSIFVFPKQNVCSLWHAIHLPAKCLEAVFMGFFC